MSKKSPWRWKTKPKRFLSVEEKRRLRAPFFVAEQGEP